MTATVSLSMEIELAWGFHDVANTFPHLSENRNEETNTLDKLLTHCEDLSIPISFNIVSYLLNHEYESIEDSPHDPNWLPVPPESDVHSHPLFYAPDLVDEIQTTATNHEICSHTYSHAILGESNPEIVEWELEKARDKHSAHGLKTPISLVPPRHSEPPVELITNSGFQILRRAYVPRMESNVKQYFHFLSRSIPVQAPVETNGIHYVLSTQNPSLTAPFLPNGQNNTHPAFRMIPKSVRERLHRRFLYSGLQRAIQEDSHVHYWTHLFNLSNDTQWPIVADFLNELKEQERKGEINVVTLKELRDSNQ